MGGLKKTWEAGRSSKSREVFNSWRENHMYDDTIYKICVCRTLDWHHLATQSEMIIEYLDLIT